MKQFKYFIFFSIFILIFYMSCTYNQNMQVLSPKKYFLKSIAKKDSSRIIYAGVRSSSYGIYPFPQPEQWNTAMDTMSSYFPGSTKCAIWIVGVMGSNLQTCQMEFPSDGKNHPHVIFKSYDKHEKYLKYFDENNIKVFLQVEPASASVPALIDLMLNRYGNHKCVIGVGIDVEWYRVSEKPEWGIPVKNDTAKMWEQRVKSFNSDYRLFLKHWDRDWMPSTYRGDIVFVDDSQGFNGLNQMVDEFTNYWAKHFYPNTVFFQYGYNWDKPWWKNLVNPPKTIGDAIAGKIAQESGMFWVDFTLKDVLPLETGVTGITE
ncbi:hypothetical protein DRQ07_06550 [candidate division KSB1 bacterium]|nr:MAG: hypothetical protein DRQ07_06550 [candidate division KSB1 bacterium]